MYNSKDFNKHAPQTPKKDILLFIQNNLKDFKKNKAFKEDKKKFLNEYINKSNLLLQF